MTTAIRSSANYLEAKGAPKARKKHQVFHLCFRPLTDRRSGAIFAGLQLCRENTNKRTLIMNAKVKPIPDGFHTLTPYLTVKGGAEAIDFYKRAFGAIERFRMTGPDGKTLGHAEITIGDSILMLADGAPGFSQSPQELHGTTVSLLLYVKDVDAAFKRAVEAGATVKQPVENKFYGERAGCVVDPFGHLWTLMTHIEDVPPQEMKKRMDEFCAKMAAAKPS
jgi:PhnB protein